MDSSYSIFRNVQLDGGYLSFHRPRRYHGAFFLSVLFIFLVFGYLIDHGYRTARDQSLKTAQNLALVLANNLEAVLSRVESDLNVFVPQMTEADLAGEISEDRRADINARLGYHLVSFPPVANYRIFDESGQSLFGAGRVNASAKINVGDRAWFATLRDESERTLVISDVVQGKSTHDWTIIIGAPIRDQGGRFKGAIVAALDLAQLQQMVEGVDLGAEGLVAIRKTDNYNLILRRPQLGDPIVGASQGAELAKRLVGGAVVGSGDFVSPIDNIARQYAYRKLSHFQLNVLVAVAQDDYLAGWRLQSTWLSGMALFLMASLAALYVLQVRVQTKLLKMNDQLQQALIKTDESDRRYQAVFASSKVAMLLINPEDGAIIDANAAAVDYYGWDFSRLVTMNIRDINALAPDLISAEIANAKRQQRSHFLFQHRLASGEIRDVEVHSGPLELGGRTLLYSLIHDVTDRRRLADERDRLFLAIEQSPISVVITDTDGLIEYVNPTFTRTTGYGLDEAIGKNPRILKSGATSDDEYKAMWQQISDGHSWSGLFHNIRKNGALYWERAQISPIVNADGKITHFLAVKEDITARIESEQAIRRLNRQLQDILAASSEVAIIASDMDGIITLFNRGAERMLGYDAQSVILKETPVLFHQAEEMAARGKELTAELGIPVSGFRVFVEKAEREGHDLRDWTYVRKDGRHIIVSLMITPVYSEDQHISGYLGVAQDISLQKQAIAKLEKSEERFRSLVEGTTDWVWESDEQQRFTWFSKSFDKIIGFSSDSLLGKRRWDVASDIHEIESPKWEAHMADLYAHRSFRDFKYWIKTGDGTAKWISINGSPLFDDYGQFLGYRGSGTDVTAQANNAMQLRMMFNVVEHSPVSVVITDPDGIIQYVNNHFCAVTGYEPDEVIGRMSRILSSGQMPQETFVQLWSTIKSGEVWTGELQNRKKDGTLHWEIVSISPICDDDGAITRFVAIKEDITFRREAEARITEANQKLEAQAHQLVEANVKLTTAHATVLAMSRTDGLTGIANRRWFDDALDQELSRAIRSQGRVGLLMMDVDCFKLFNDNYGHAAGDDCLRAVAKAIQSVVKRPTDLVARYGGEELTCILPNTDAKGVEDVGNAILDAIRSLAIPHAWSEAIDIVTLSIGGISFVPNNDSTPKQVIEAADAQLYVAKKSGRNCLSVAYTNGPYP